MLDMFKRNSQYRETFSTPQGKAVLKDLLKFCHMYAPTHCVGDPYQTAYNEGMRRVALRITSILKMDDSAMRELIKKEGQSDE